MLLAGFIFSLQGIVFISILSLGLFLFWAIFDVHGAQVSFGLPNVSASGQISFLLHHKLRAIKMFTLGTISDLGSNPGKITFIGCLGWQDAVFHKIFYQIAYLTLALVFINSFFIQTPKLLSKTFVLKLVLFLGFVFVSYDLIFLALYITWTPVGLNVIEGLQGRYFLPLIMMFALLPRLAPPRIVMVKRSMGVTSLQSWKYSYYLSLWSIPPIQLLMFYRCDTGNFWSNLRRPDNNVFIKFFLKLTFTP